MIKRRHDTTSFCCSCSYSSCGRHGSGWGGNTGVCAARSLSHSLACFRPDGAGKVLLVRMGLGEKYVNLISKIAFIELICKLGREGWREGERGGDMERGRERDRESER